MNVMESYKQEVNAFCDKNCKMAGLEMLKLAQEHDADRDTEDSNVIAFEPKEKKKRSVKKTIVRLGLQAACLVVLSLTVVAATGKISDMLRNVHQDETSAQLVEEGYVFEVKDIKQDGIFKLDFLGVTGDRRTPKLLFEVWVDDEKLAAENETIELCVYTLGVYEFENELDRFGTFEGIGTKDEEIPNLYHVSITGAPAWMCYGEPFVVCASQINTSIDGGKNKVSHDISMRWDLTIPISNFHPVKQVTCTGMKYTYNDIDYWLMEARFGEYTTELSFYYEFVGSELVGDKTQFSQADGTLHNNWTAFIKEAVLIVDGTEYKVNEGGIYYADCDEDGTRFRRALSSAGYLHRAGVKGVPNLCAVACEFPHVDYHAANSIELKVGETIYKVK